MIRAALLMMVTVGASAAQAITLELPQSATLTREVVRADGARAIPTGPTQDGFTPTVLAQGDVTLQAYAVADMTSTGAIMAALSDQIAAAGYTTLLECVGTGCGGFDFRFSLNLIPPPDMFVDLSDYHFVSADNGAGGYITVLVSRSQNDGFVHIVKVVPAGSAAPEIAAALPEPDAADRAFRDRLLTTGRVPLDDLVFRSGSAELAQQPYASLSDLAAFLRDHPQHRVAFVGHTDASGALDVNVAISRRRAEAARAQFLNLYDIPAQQVTAEGMGFLAPRATNLTAEGRERNRRVEVILLSTAP